MFPYYFNVLLRYFRFVPVYQFLLGKSRYRQFYFVALKMQGFKDSESNIIIIL